MLVRVPTCAHLRAFARLGMTLTPGKGFACTRGARLVVVSPFLTAPVKVRYVRMLIQLAIATARKPIWLSARRIKNFTVMLPVPSRS